MTTKTADEIVVGANGTIYRAPLNATIPDDIDNALDAAFVDLGYASEDGVTWTDGKTVKSHRAWQSFYDLRRTITAREGSVKFTLLQWSGLNFQTAFGGGNIEETSPGLFTFTPPSPEEIDEFTLAVEWQDGTKEYRLIVPRVMVSENVETNVTRADMAMLPITCSLLGAADTVPFYVQTNDPAFADVAGSGS